MNPNYIIANIVVGHDSEGEEIIVPTIMKLHPTYGTYSRCTNAELRDAVNKLNNTFVVQGGGGSGGGGVTTVVTQ